MPVASPSQEQSFPWPLTQERLDLLAAVLYKAETIFNVVDSGCLAAERAACLLTDLREKCCQVAGADAPFADMPLSPCFDRGEADSNLFGSEGQ